MISFIIYFHSSRSQNLHQTLRFLVNREKKLAGSEIILICQDDYHKVNVDGFIVNQVNLKMESYNKSIMCNVGAKISKSELLVFLDSDRILPYNYFYNTISLLNNNVITTRILYSLDKQYADKEIENNLIIKKPDHRSLSNASRYKNLFSGNTMISKSDYFKIGQMDENFIGYGFADTEMTYRTKLYGIKPIFLEEEELHLYHDKKIYYKGDILHDFKILTAINALKYIKKHKLRIDKPINGLINEIKNNINVYPKDLIQIFKELIGVKM